MKPDQQETLIRIVREAVTNATRHGRASRIRIRSRTPRGHCCRWRTMAMASTRLASSPDRPDSGW